MLQHFLKISDYNGKILAVNSGHGGRTHDARVWNGSIISAYLEEQYQNRRRNGWLLGMVFSYFNLYIYFTVK